MKLQELSYGVLIAVLPEKPPLYLTVNLSDHLQHSQSSAKHHRLDGKRQANMTGSSLKKVLVLYREELQQPVFAALDVLEFPELHDESIPFLAFTRCLTRLMTAAGVRDFSLQVEPSPS